MRTVARPGFVLLVALLAVLSPGCDSRQPMQATNQRLDLFIDMPGAVVRQYDTWEVFQDSGRCSNSPGTLCTTTNDSVCRFCSDLTTPCTSNANCTGIGNETCGTCNGIDGMPDDIDGDGEGDVALYCRRSVDGSNNPLVVSPTSVHWGFGIQISIIRAGTVTSSCENANCSVLLTSASASQPTSSLNQARSDTASSSAGLPSQPFAPPVIVDMGQRRRFVFRNPRRLSEAHPDVLRSTDNFLHQLRPTLYGGLCPGTDPGPAMIDEAPQPFSIDINPGDTVIVSAARSPNSPEGLMSNQPPRISASLFLNGNRVNLGGATSGDEQISFSFTSR